MIKKTKQSAASKAAKKPAASKSAKTAKAPKIIKEKLTKSQQRSMLAEQAGVTKKDVDAVFQGVEDMMAAALKKGAAGEFNLYGLMKVVSVRKPATKARKGINPFTKEEVTFKAKPARTVVKVRPLKKLKDMV